MGDENRIQSPISGFLPEFTVHHSGEVDVLQSSNVLRELARNLKLIRIQPRDGSRHAKVNRVKVNLEISAPWGRFSKITACRVCTDLVDLLPSPPV